MKTLSIRIVSLLICVVIVLSLVPSGVFALAEAEKPDTSESARVLTEDDYATIDAVFDQISDMETSPAKKNIAQSQITDAAAAIVTASDGYVEGSLARNGDSFTWETEAGIRCVYRLFKIWCGEIFLKPYNSSP